MREDIAVVSQAGTHASYGIEMAGISYCDGTYHIKRQKSSVYVFEYILSGCGTVITAAQRFYPGKGDVYILREGTYHEYYADPQDPWVKIWFNVYGYLPGHLLQDYGLESVSYVPQFEDATMFYQFLHIAHQADLSDEEKRNRTSLLLHMLLQQIASRIPAREAAHRQEAGIMKHYIDNHLSSRIRIEELARLIYRSPSQAIRLFREAYQIPPCEYALRRRLETAAMLLTGTNLPIQEIAERTGFCDGHYFSNIFRKRYGASPRMYRNQIRGHIHKNGTKMD